MPVLSSDFVPIDNLKRTQRLVGELRRQRLSTSWSDDVLAFYTTLIIIGCQPLVSTLPSKSINAISEVCSALRLNSGVPIGGSPVIGPVVVLRRCLCAVFKSIQVSLAKSDAQSPMTYHRTLNAVTR